MKAAVVRAFDRPPTYEDFDEPTPGPDEAVATVTAAGLHVLVRLIASGKHYSSTGELPMIPGVDGVARFASGKRVYFGGPRGRFGTMAERAAVNVHAFELPAAGSDAHYAAVTNPGMSSWLALGERAHLKAGESVLVLGATGTSGALAVQVARRLGAGRVIAAARNAAALERVDADVRIPLQKEAIVGLGPVDIVLDYLWGDVAELALGALAKGRTRYVQIGAMAGDAIRLPAALLRSRDLQILGSGIGSVPWDAMAREIPRFLEIAASLTIDFDAVPLADVATVWSADEKRIVFVP